MFFEYHLPAALLTLGAFLLCQIVAARHLTAEIPERLMGGLSLLGFALGILHLADFIEFSWAGRILSAVAIGLILGKGLKPILARDTLTVTAGVVGAVALVLVPVLFFLPQNTLVPGHFVCNDSVNHAYMSQGFAATRAFPANVPHLAFYPRGIHALVLEFSRFFGVDRARSLFGVTVVFQAFVFIPLLYVARRTSTKMLAPLIALSATLPFLVTTTTYCVFLAQIGSLPFILGTWACLANREPLRGQRLLIFSGLAVGSFTTYGFVSLIAFGFGGLAYCLIGGRNLLSSLRARATSKAELTTLAAFIILSALPCYLAIRLVLFDLDPKTTIGLTTSLGNVPGFLSPLHLTGLWYGNYGYREFLGGTAHAQVLFFISLVLAAGLHRTLQRHTEFHAACAALVCPLALLIFVIPEPYIFFKFSVILIPAFLVLSLSGITELLGNHRGPWIWASRTLLVGYLLGAVLLPRQSWEGFPILLKEHWDQLEYLDQHYIKRFRTLVLSKEDWIQYFLTDQEDWDPLTTYLSRQNKDAPEVVVFDRASAPDNNDWLARYPKLRAKMDSAPAKCRELIGDRYEAISLSCAGQS